MRVLAICQEDPEWILGGMGRHVRELYRAMAEQGVSVDILTSGPAEGTTEYLGCQKHHADKLVCWKPRQPDMSSLLVADIQLTKTLARLIAQGRRWDVVHVHEWNALQVARIARDALDVPLVGTMHLCITDLTLQEWTTETKYQETDLYLMQQEGHLVVGVDELILCSRAYERTARRVFMTDRPVNVIHNGIRAREWARDPVLAARVLEKYGLADLNRPIALFVGRIADMKGIRPLLDAVETRDTGYQIVVAGEVNANTEEDKERWDVTHRLRKLCEEFPERVKWVGFQDDDADLRGLYSAADVGLMPSINEPFGIVALEFMAAGVPLISTEVEGLGEIVTEDDQEFSLIIEPGSASDIVEALTFLRYNRPAKAELSALGLQRVEDFTWQDAAAKTREVYENVKAA
jgi:glycosyltransferase involved in cell wall biosynthesis